MDLRINQQFGQLGLDIKQPAFDLKVYHPWSELKISSPQLEIDYKHPRVKIDQTQCFVDVGRRSPMEFLRHMVGLARRAGLEGIGRIAGEGDLLAAIEKGIDIADIALMNSQSQDEFNVAAVPEHRPVIKAIVESVHINVQPGNVVVRPRNGQVMSQLDWGQVGVNWRQKPAIDIEYVGKSVDVSA